MRLYHGSTVEITEIDLSKSKPNKDFGKGFYLSDDWQQAFEMATFKSILLGGKPVITAFEFDENIIRYPNALIKVKSFEDYSEEWVRFVLANRLSGRKDLPVHGYDIVYGPIANDRVGLQVRNYLEQNIDLVTLLHRLKYMKGITFQYFFGTERAIKLLKKI